MLEMLCKTWLTTRCFLLLRRSRQLSGAFNHALFICSYFFFFFTSTTAMRARPALSCHLS